jgi:SAM-dependent methyltransferase
LHLATILKREADVILEGMLLCPNLGCQREYPIIDGIPLILANLRGFLAENLHQLTARDDLSAVMESVLGDCAGPGSQFDITRHQLGSYARDHYGQYDPEEPDSEPRPGATARLLATGLGSALPVPEGPLLDLGCSVGGTTFALAQQTGRLVLGIDLNLAMLRVAASALYRGVVQYPRKRTGVVYDRRRLQVNFPCAEQVDFWACDVSALPFAENKFALAAALNLLDCVRAPRDLLAEVARTLMPGGKVVLTSPYDWSPVATPIEGWLGGHSQRGAGQGKNEPMLRAILTPGGHPAAIGTLAIESEVLEVPWHVRLHDRSTVSYRVHLVVARKPEPTT